MDKQGCVKVTITLELDAMVNEDLEVDGDELEKSVYEYLNNLMEDKSLDFNYKVQGIYKTQIEE
jgi:hypothetical protein